MRRSWGFWLCEKTAPTELMCAPQLGHLNSPSTMGSSTWAPQSWHLAYTVRAIPPGANKPAHGGHLC